MKKSHFILTALLMFLQVVRAQPGANYFELINKAKSSFTAKEYKKSGQAYAAAFKSNGGKAYMEDRYHAARAWTLAGMKDSAFVQLFKVVTLYDYINYSELSTDKAFATLYNDKRWKEVDERVKLNIAKSDGNLNKALVLLLDSVYRDYHSNRLKEVGIKNEFGAESEELKTMKATIQQRDAINLKIVTEVIDTYGWLGRGSVGFIGNYSLALIIQQAELSVQEKYLPKMREAYRAKNAEAQDLAVLEDKVALKKNKKQIFGTAIVTVNGKNYVAPMEDVDNLNKRRSDLGLKSMNEYLQSWGMKWDVNKYKKDLVLLEKETIDY